MPKPLHNPAEPELDFEHHLPAGMESFTVRWLAAWFNTSHQHWINLIEQGLLKATDLRGRDASKSMLRVPRAELIRYLNSKATA